jgi:hypothetical protein
VGSLPQDHKYFPFHPARFLGQTAWPSLLAVLVSACLVLLTVPASGQTLVWKAVPSPSPGPAAAFDELAGVSCVSAASCTAVGDHENKFGVLPDKTLIESWNGTRWSAVSSPDNGKDDVLFGVSCVLKASCTAVGTRFPRTLVESWNGTRWSVVPSPNPGPAAASDELLGVSCVSAAFCAAVGSGGGNGPHPDTTLIETWNGTHWSALPSPDPAADGDVLNGVSCVSASSCTAVGFGFVSAGGGDVRAKTLIESWNGKSWTVASSPDPSGNDTLYGVSCMSASSCTAVGSGGAKTLIESWNGKSWTVVPSPNSGPAGGADELLGVSCVSAASCTAAGSYTDKNGEPPAMTLIESWNGTRWTVVPSPNPKKNDGLYGVSCVSAAACTAAGDAGSSSGVSKTVIESD